MNTTMATIIPTTKKVVYAVAAVASAGLVAGSLAHRLPMDPTEVLGFVTGAWCVWLTVEENIWNWPIGIANSLFYVAVFLQARLFADMSLQVIYVALGFLGWYWWLRGGAGKTALRVSRTGAREGLALAAIAVACTAGMTLVLQRVADAAPFPDALTTVLSLAAQYMLTRKLLENWTVWIVADVIYIVLYVYKGLYLTSALYAIYLALCIAGLAQWRASLRAGSPRAEIERPVGAAVV